MLFVCLGNSCRSPMAEAIARHEASDVIDASSAGIAPLGFIAKPTIATLAECGIAAHRQTSKPLTSEAVDACDLLVNMSGRPLPPLVKRNAKVEDWDVEDPYGEDPQVYRRTCEDIRRRVNNLAQRIRNERARKNT